MELLGRGSAKNLYRDPASPQSLFFSFSDRISVFDYGALPQEIPGKGESLARTGIFFFEVLKEHNVATAYESSARFDGNTVLKMRAARHAKFPGIQSESLEFIPLEIIFRWGVTPGSSLLKRDPSLKPFEKFLEPRIEFTTKLEASDRLLNVKEAAELLPRGLRLEALSRYTENVADILKNSLKARGMDLWDGKIECAYESKTGQIVLIDAITLDEIRVTLPGLERIPLSKELLRMWYRSTNWAFDIKLAKLRFGDGWKQELKSKPPDMGTWRLEKLSSLYTLFADSLTAGNAGALLDWARKDLNPPSVHIVGGGGREAAIKWKLQQEGVTLVDNPNVADAIWVSPDAELAAGMVNEFEAQGKFVFGPRKEAARIEWSKAFGKDVARSAGVDIPRTSNNIDDLHTFDSPPVVKMDGLAAGKGVVVTESFFEAEVAFGDFSKHGKVLFEERLDGFEASIFFYCEMGGGDPKAHYLGSARDFKRRYAGDEGPNTGGMGSYAPHPTVARNEILTFCAWAESTLRELERRDICFNGILYLGAMKDTRKGWKLLEYNARFGDPETEALLVLWPEGHALRKMLKLDLHHFSEHEVDLEPHTSVLCLALVHPNYPSASAEPMHLPAWEPRQKEVHLFKTQSTKGRVAFLVSKGTNLQTAGDKIFDELRECPWKNLLEWRVDILK